MNWLEKLKENDTARRVLVFVLLGVVLYLLRSMIDLILLTFIFAFLVTRLENVILKKGARTKKANCHCTLFASSSILICRYSAFLTNFN